MPPNKALQERRGDRIAMHTFSLTNTVGLLKVRQSATWKSNGIPDIKGFFKVTRPTVRFISQGSF